MEKCDTKLKEQSKRFKFFRENIIKKSQTELADFLNSELPDLQIKQPSIADIESGRKQKIDTNILLVLVKFYKLELKWLLLGIGEPVADMFYNASEQEKIIPIPFYTAKAAAGSGEQLPEYSENEIMYFDSRWLKNVIGIKPEHASIIQARGDSMDSGINKPDDIKDGDLLLIDDSVKEVLNNRIFVIEINNQLVVKRVIKELSGNVILYSNNPKYTPRVLQNNDNAKIIGRVVWNGSKENI